MALTGQLNDLSLAELIEFFCNQRKTGRLKVAYPQVPGIFYIKDGELVDARVGALAGVEAVYYALRQPNARFDFQPQREASERTIHEPWAQVVLEGLRRLDEGVPVGDPLAGLSEDDLARLREESADDTSAEAVPFAMSANGDGRRRAVGVGVAAVALLICATAVGALTDWFGLKRANTVVAAPPAAAVPQPQPTATPAVEAAPQPSVEAERAAKDAAEATKMELVRRERERAERERRQAEKNAREVQSAETQKKPEAVGGQTVMVRVFVDDQGRVSQATVANSRPGMEAYEASALRIARQRRYPSGKSGWVTVPIKFN